MGQPKETYFQNNSIINTFKVLEAMVAQGEWDLRELSAQVQMNKATVLRVLLNLKSLGYVEQTDVGKKYYVTTKLFDIGSKAIPNIDVFKLSRPIMAKLQEQCDETVYLLVLSGIDAVVITKIASRHYLKLDAYVGDRLKSYQTSGGKALLATMTSEERARLFEGHQFEQMTHKGIASLEELEADVEKTRSRGYALVDEERYFGIRSVGVAIFNHVHEPVAALSAAAPSPRLSLEDIPKFAEMVSEAGQEISQKMGANFSGADANRHSLNN